MRYDHTSASGYRCPCCWKQELTDYYRGEKLSLRACPLCSIEFKGKDLQELTKLKTKMQQFERMQEIAKRRGARIAR